MHSSIRGGCKEKFGQGKILLENCILNIVGSGCEGGEDIDRQAERYFSMIVVVWSPNAIFLGFCLIGHFGIQIT